MSSEFRVVRSLAEATADFGPCALTIGNFDGVHIGHLAIMRRAEAAARERGWRAAAMTFDPHPASVVAPPKSPRLLTTMERRFELMRQAGIDEVMALPFTPAIAALEPRQFVEEIMCSHLRPGLVLVGENFRFGRGAAGDAALLGELGRGCGFQVEACAAVCCRGEVVSSSLIRARLSAGDVTGAWRMLARPHDVHGRVIPGRGVGRKQTVPTLNLELPPELLPSRGVYVTRTFDLEDARCWPSVTNIGHRPTFGGGELSIETFLLSPLEGADPERIRIAFLSRLRDERRFDNPEALKAQIFRDVKRARTFLRRTSSLL